MTIRESTLAKVQQMPESLLQEVNDFIDFLSVKQIQPLKEEWTKVCEIHESATPDLSTYLYDLEQYENQLSRGDIQW